MLKKNLNTILGNFSKTLTDLKKFAEANTNEIEKNKEVIASIEQDQDRLEMERARANSVIANLEKLLAAA